MSATNFGTINAEGSRVKMVSALPSTPQEYYGGPTNDVANVEWSGGEYVYLSTDRSFYMQVATSGTTSKWRRAGDIFLASTTTSTSTSTSSTTSTSTSTSSTTTSA